ncbi:MAG TPA: hypothetical protein VF898_07805 [Chloroflexota bacterium]
MKRRDKVIIAAILLAVAVFTAGYEFIVPHHHPPPGVTLTDLSSVHQLQTLFNRDRGEPRLILIFSPT